MSEETTAVTATTETVTPPTAAEVQKTSEVLMADLAKDIQVIKATLADYKAHGTLGVVTDVPAIMKAVKQTNTDIETATPLIKAGYKTTEFWLVAGLVCGNALFTMFTAKTLPIDLNITLSAVVGLYTALRGVLKK